MVGLDRRVPCEPRAKCGSGIKRLTTLDFFVRDEWALHFALGAACRGRQELPQALTRG
jgi:hypothetical protein